MNFLVNTFFKIIPPPRRPFRWHHPLSLVIFLLLYGATLFTLEYKHVLLFTKPEAFWLLLITPWVWWMFEAGSSGLTAIRGQIAFWIRMLVIGVFIMILAEPRAVRESQSLSVVYALDLSDSIGDNAVDSALKYVVRTAQERPEKDEAGLIVFGKDAAVELPPRAAFPFETVNSLISKDGTNLEKGISLASAMLPEGKNGRIVLISDGTATSGNLKSVLSQLKARGVAVDVLPVQYDFNDEVWLEKLELPAHVKQGETYEASVVLSSLKDGTGELVLQENGEPILRQKVSFKAGKNRFSLPIYMRAPGYYEYTAIINLPKGRDGWQRNNVAINYLYLKGKGKVLLVKDSFADERDWKHLLGFLQKGNREVEVIDPFDFPRDVMAFMPYDCIIFDNVPADAFDVVQLQNVRDAVFNLGIGFLMVGGQNSFGPGGYHRTPVEEMLPVNMDITNKKVLPKGALAIILHTCEFANGNTWAKRIAKSAIKVLGKQDEVGLLAWDGGENWVFPLTPAAEYEELAKKVNSCSPGDMPSFVGTMEMALKGLNKSDAATKHLIIISDGDPQPPSPQLLKKYKDNMISITTVLVDGYHQGGFQKIMRLIANATGGRFYYVKNPNQLPSIFIKEAKTLKKSMIQNKTFTPTVEFNDGTILKGIKQMKPLHGYVLTSMKNDARRCTVVLKGPDEDQVDPVLAVGRFGLGRSAAFTSDLGTNWARDWMNWGSIQPFLNQLMVAISRVSKEGNLRARSYTSGDKGIVVVEDYFPEMSMLEVNAQVMGPEGKSQLLKLKQVGPQRYVGDFSLWGKGRYQVMIAGAGKDRQERTATGFVIPYSAEYLHFKSNPVILNEIVERTGGRLLDGAEKGEEIFMKERKTQHTSKPIFDIFLILLAFLIPLDVGVRRVQIDFMAISKKLFSRKREQDSTETLGALLKRKEAVSSQMGHQDKDDRPVKPATKPSESSMSSLLERKAAAKKDLAATKPVEVKKDTVKKEETPKPDADNVSTTGRLLAMKRKRKTGDDDEE